MDGRNLEPPAASKTPPRKTVALVLGSGSSRGWAHIGAIEALVNEGIPIDFISGCSVGSYVGAIYASGSLASLKDFVLSMDGKKVFSYFDVVFPRSGLLDGTKKVAELFSMHTAVQHFSELNIPVMMVATDLQRGEKVVLRSGNLLQALRATMSVPGLFAPARFKGRWLVDGGIVDPVPVGVARATEADVVIAVDLNSGITSRRMKTPKKNEVEQSGPDAPRFNSELLTKLTDYYETAESNLKTKCIFTSGIVSISVSRKMSANADLNISDTSFHTPPHSCCGFYRMIPARNYLPDRRIDRHQTFSGTLSDMAV